MTGIKVNGTRLNYVESGRGPETVVFAHGLLMSHRMYQPQVQRLSATYRCIAYDHRGQGASEITASGYDMDNLARDAAELIRALDAAPCHFVGLSMGGFVGLRLAIRHPELLRSLVLLDTSADPEPRNSHRRYRAMIAVARWFGFRPLAGTVMSMLFGHTFMQDPAREEERAFWRRRVLGVNRNAILRATRAVIDREGVSDSLGSIRVPTLVMVGEEDTVTPPLLAERMRDRIAGARLAIIRHAGHSSTIEAPESVSAELAAFLAAVEAQTQPPATA